MFKFFLRVSMFLVFAVILVGQYFGPASVNAADKPKLNLKFAIGHAVGPATYRQMGALEFVDELKKQIDGNVTVEILHSGTLGTEAQMLEAVQLGTLQMAILSSPVLTSVLPKMGALDLPYIWRDLDHFFKVLDGPIGASLTKNAKEHGFIVLSYWIGGIRNTYGNVEIKSVDDMKGVKIRILQSPVFLETFKAFGAIPTPISWPETYQALQTGTVNAVETALPSMIDAKQYEISKYVMITRHAINPTAVVVNAKWWDSFPPNVQEIFKQSIEAGKKVDRSVYLGEEEKAINFLKEKGLKIVYPDLAGFSAKAQPVYKKFSDKIGQDTIDAIQGVK